MMGCHSAMGRTEDSAWDGQAQRRNAALRVFKVWTWSHDTPVVLRSHDTPVVLSMNGESIVVASRFLRFPLRGTT